jgi:hypothetical protein
MDKDDGFYTQAWMSRACHSFPEEDVPVHAVSGAKKKGPRSGPKVRVVVGLSVSRSCATRLSSSALHAQARASKLRGGSRAPGAPRGPASVCE